MAPAWLPAGLGPLGGGGGGGDRPPPEVQWTSVLCHLEYTGILISGDCQLLERPMDASSRAGGSSTLSEKWINPQNLR